MDMETKWEVELNCDGRVIYHPCMDEASAMLIAKTCSKSIVYGYVAVVVRDGKVWEAFTRGRLAK